MATLNNSDALLINNPSIPAIQSIFYDINSNFVNKSWLKTNNRYRDDCVAQIKSDLKANPKQIDKKHLAEYIVASTPVHCLDGWSYLGRAIECHFRGDIANAKHLGYYAELRAAMSILASQGIGIFDHQHFIIDRNGDAQELSTHAGTHDMVWLVLNEWAKHAPSKNLLASVIQPKGIPLSQWLDFFVGSSNAYQAVADKLFTDLGFDLERFEKDKRARNESSYRPNRISSFQSQNFSHDVNYVCGLWDIFEFGGSQGFEKIDLFLLRICLHNWFNSTNQIPDLYQDPTHKKNFETKIDYMIFKMGFGHSQNTFLKGFLFDQNFTYPQIFEEARKKDGSRTFNQHIQLLSRASLLLRIATGANAGLLLNSKTKLNDIQYWWGPLGIERGLWEVNSTPTQFNELWDDIKVALDDTTTCLCNPDLNLYECHKNNGFSFAKLGECERIALWGFGI